MNVTDPTGALSRPREIPSSAIVSANNEVKKIASSSENSESKKRGPFSLPNALILVVATDHRLHNTAS